MTEICRIVKWRDIIIDSDTRIHSRPFSISVDLSKSYCSGYLFIVAALLRMAIDSPMISFLFVVDKISISLGFVTCWFLLWWRQSHTLWAHSQRLFFTKLSKIGRTPAYGLMAGRLSDASPIAMSVMKHNDNNAQVELNISSIYFPAHASRPNNHMLNIEPIKGK